LSNYNESDGANELMLCGEDKRRLSTSFSANVLCAWQSETEVSYSTFDGCV